MKKKLMIILTAAFLMGNLGLNAQVVNTDTPTEDVEEEIDEEDDEDADEDEQDVLSEDEFAVTDQEGNEEVIEFSCFFSFID